MNNLNINQINIGGQSVTTIDSREVAEMLEKEHKYVLRDIEGTDDVVGIIPTLIGANLHSSKYFIESSYKDARNRIQKCYLVTKMGCELLGNKQQGEKSVFSRLKQTFTAIFHKESCRISFFLCKFAAINVLLIEKTFNNIITY